MAEITVNEAPQEIARRKKRNLIVDILVRMFKTKPLGFFGLCIVLILCLTAIFANQLSPYGWNQIMLQYRLAPPQPGLILGADNVGRDVLSRIIYGARISITVMLIAQACTLVLKLLLAIPAGYWGGSTYDTILQRFIDAWSAIPS